MPILTVRHVTTYRYRQPVSFGEHRMMLRPRDGHDQRLLEARITILPEPSSFWWVHDVFGNSVGVAQFAGGNPAQHGLEPAIVAQQQGEAHHGWRRLCWRPAARGGRP